MTHEQQDRLYIYKPMSNLICICGKLTNEHVAPESATTSATGSSATGSSLPEQDRPQGNDMPNDDAAQNIEEVVDWFSVARELEVAYQLKIVDSSSSSSETQSH